MRKRLATKIAAVTVTGLVIGIGGSLVTPLEAEEDVVLLSGPLRTNVQMAQTVDKTNEEKLGSSELTVENRKLRKSLDNVTGRMEVLESEITSLKNKANIDPFLAGVYPVQTKMGLKLAQIHFDTGSADLSPGATRRILAVADWLDAAGGGKVTLMGLSDTNGPAEKNLELSKARADSVAALLEEQGLGRNTIKIDARGETFQVEKTADGVSEPLNRCVGIFVDSEAGKRTSLLQ